MDILYILFKIDNNMTKKDKNSHPLNSRWETRFPGCCGGAEAELPLHTHFSSQYLAWQSRLQDVIVRKPQNRFIGKSDLYENIILLISQYVKYKLR